MGKHFHPGCGHALPEQTVRASATPPDAAALNHRRLYLHLHLQHGLPAERIHLPLFAITGAIFTGGSGAVIIGGL
jgi:hypothetical protein